MERIQTSNLTWDPASRTFTAEISDFGPRFRFGRVYPDACDLGLMLVSDRTGTEAAFAVAREIRSKDVDDELQAWELEPTREAIRRNPGLRGTKIVLFND